MIVYHGTTTGRARRICAEGFLAKKPSRRVWFAESKAYALGRAKTQARRSRDRPVVLTCDLDVNWLRMRYGRRRVLHRNRVLAVDGPVPVTVLRSHPFANVPTTPEEIARWVNDILGLKPHKGVGRRHPGALRLSEWVNKRLQSDPRTRIKPRELFLMARRWLAEFFEGYEVDPDHLRAFRAAGAIEVEVDEEACRPDPREDEALECLDSDKATCRARGLALLAKLGDPDLFDWCVMFLNDEAVTMQLAALETMPHCDDGYPEIAEPLAASDNKRIRAAALAVLAKLAAPDDAPRWFERGLKDPSPCVRIAVARQLGRLAPAEHQALFELALTDPNPDAVRAARKHAGGLPSAALTW